MWKSVRKCYEQNYTIIWTLEACGNRNWIHFISMPWVYVCNGWTCLIRKQMVIHINMICCWLYYYVKLDEMHTKDWMKEAYMLRPRIGTLAKSHMMNLCKLVWNSMNMGLVYMSMNCYKLYWWILDNTIEDLKWCWKGWIGENLAKWTCVDVCVVWWWVINGVWFSKVLCPSRVRNIGRGKTSVNLTLGQKGVKPETTSSSLLISKLAATRAALMIYESIATQFHQ